MPKLGDISNVWSTVREINVSDIRESAEQPVNIAIIGTSEQRSHVIRALMTSTMRYPAAERPAIREFDVPLPRDRQSEVGRSDLAVLIVDMQQGVSREAQDVADKLSMLAIPRVALLIGDQSATSGDGELYLTGTHTVTVPDTQPATLAKRLLPVIAEQLSDDLRIAAARRMPGLRDAVARWLIGDVSFSNASYALTSGIPEMVPVLNIPLNAADMLVLSKNQALLVYKLALAFGAPADFQAQMKEVLPVIGSGFLWRQVARQLVGLIPGFGIVPKVAVAYAGTYATGQAAAVWYRSGEVLSRDALKTLYRQAMKIGRERATELMRRRKENGTAATGPTRRLPTPRTGWRRFWPFGRKQS